MTKTIVIYKNQYGSLAAAVKGDQVFRYTQDNNGFYSKYLGSVEVDRLPRTKKAWEQVLMGWDEVEIEDKIK